MEKTNISIEFKGRWQRVVRPGQWSARKAQMMAKAYKKAGGGYK